MHVIPTIDPNNKQKLYQMESKKKAWNRSQQKSQDYDFYLQL